MFATPSKPIERASQNLSFPKEARLLKRSEFQSAYEKGFRISGPYFAAVCLRIEGQARAKVGFAAPKPLGGSVARNRMRRRLREAVRLSLGQLAPEWAVVVQLRRAALEAPFAELKREVERMFSRCGTS